LNLKHSEVWFKFGGIIVDTREHEKICKVYGSIHSKKKEEKKIGASKLGIGFICSIEKGEKYFHDLNTCSLSSRYFCYPKKNKFPS